jgi:hypothetical protein
MTQRRKQANLADARSLEGHDTLTVRVGPDAGVV